MSTALAHAIARNRAVRRQTAALTRSMLGSLTRDGVFIPLPVGQPARRDTYRTVNSEAHRILGTGQYRLRGGDGGVWLWRQEAA